MSASILVVGGAGYIGSHFCALLEERGINYVVLDDLSRGRRGTVPEEKLVVGRAGDSEVVREICRTRGVDAAVHFAAYAYVGESVEDPLRYYENNVSESVRFFGTLVDLGIRNVVFSSTCATYGIPENPKPIDESMRQEPVNPYGRTKLAVEWLLGDLHRATRLRYAALRYFNAAGCGKNPNLAEHHDPETHLIPLAIRATRDATLTVFGDDYPTPDGTCIRDYIHVDDLATAHLAAIEKLRAGAGELKINLGSGVGASVKDVIRIVSDVAGSPVTYTMGPRREGDPPVLVANASRAKSILQWRPQYDNLRSIVESAYVGSRA